MVPEPLVVPLCRTCFGQVLGPLWQYGRLALVRASHLLTRRWVPPTPRGLGCEPCTGFSGCKAGITELLPKSLIFPLSFALVPFITEALCLTLRFPPWHPQGSQNSKAPIPFYLLFHVILEHKNVEAKTEILPILR